MHFSESSTDDRYMTHSKLPSHAFLDSILKTNQFPKNEYFTQTREIRTANSNLRGNLQRMNYVDRTLDLSRKIAQCLKSRPIPLNKTTEFDALDMVSPNVACNKLPFFSPCQSNDTSRSKLIKQLKVLNSKRLIGISQGNKRVAEFKTVSGASPNSGILPRTSLSEIVPKTLN